MPENESQEVRPAKRRALKACDECHRRKVKCNSSDMPDGVCSNCLALKTECKHSVQAQKRGPKTGSKRKPASEVKNLIYKILSAPLSFAIPEDFEVIRDMLVDIAKYARTLETQVNQLRPLDKPSFSPSSSASPPVTSESNQDSDVEDKGEGINVVDSLATRFNNIGLGKFRRRHITPGSQSILQTALDIRDEVNGAESRVMSKQQQRPEFWALSAWHKIYEPEDPKYVFPEDDLMQTLVSLFFSCINPHFPLLNGTIFKRQAFEEKLHLRDPTFAATLLTVCALGSRHCSDPRNLYDGSQSERSVGWKYFQQIRLARAKLIHPASLFEIQLYVLASLFLQPTPLGDMSSSLVGMAIRFAQEVGAHRKQQKGENHQERVERELWKRAYWVLIALDGLLSASTGRPRATTENDYDLDLLIECDDEYWDESNSGVSFVQPHGQPSYVASWNHLLRLLQVAGYAQSQVPAVRLRGGESAPEVLQQALSKLDTALNHWVDSIPEHLRWDPHNTNAVFFRQSMMLRTSLLSFQMRVHAWWIRPGPVSPLSFSSLAICTNAARSFTHILVLYHQRPDFVMLPFMIPVAFLSSVLLLINIWKQTWMNSALDPEKDLAKVRTCMDIMSLYEQRFEMPGRFRDVLQAIISASRIPSISRQNLLKRTREDESSLNDGHSTPLFIAPDLSFEIPPASSTSEPFEFPYPGQLFDEASNPRMSDYDQEDWNTFMTMVDDLLSQTSNPSSDYVFS